MKSKAIIMLVFVLILSIINADKSNAKNEKAKSYVKVIYFHGEQRCQTCLTIEELTKHAVEGNFSNELKSGEIVLNVINYDEEKNKHYMDDYKLYNQALIVVKYVEGKQKKWKDLPKIWEFSGDSKKFFSYVKNEVKKYLSMK